MIEESSSVVLVHIAQHVRMLRKRGMQESAYELEYLVNEALKNKPYFSETAFKNACQLAPS